LIITGLAHGAFGQIFPVENGSAADYSTNTSPAVFHLFYGIAILVGYWCAALINWITDRHQIVFRAASARIPEPYEIEQTLYAQLGRQPTLEEVGAIHTMLIERRHEAQLHAGLIIGGLLYFSRNRHPQ